jgi:hypothetical protein
MQKAVWILAMLVLAGVAQAQEGYFRAEGQVALCGLAAANQPALLAQLRATPDLAAEPSGSPRFTLLRAADGLTDWLLTTAADPAHPAVSCRQLGLNAEGRVQMHRGLHCDAAKTACDQLWAELRELDAALRTQLAAR